MSATGTPIIVVLAIVLALVAAGLTAVVIIGRRAGVRRPSCGACGYAVAGLEGMTCPECGADLREVGIVTPGSSGSPWLIPFMVAILWSIGLAIVGSLVTPLVYRAFPRPFDASASWTLTPSNRQFATVTIDFAGEGGSSGGAGVFYEQGSIREMIPGRTQGTGIEFDLPRLTEAGTGQTLDTAVIATWLATNDPSRPTTEVDRAAGELLTHVRSGATPGGAMLIQGPAIYGGGSVRSKTGRRPPPGWLVPSMAAGWGVVWLAGLWFIRRHYRARRAPIATA